MSTLLEELKKLDAQKMVFLGSGSAWLDIAKAGEMRKNGYLKKLSDREKQKLTNSLETAEKSLMWRLTHPPKWNPPTEKETLEDSINDYIHRMENRQKEIRSAQDSIVYRRGKVDRFVPLMEREVKDIYPRLSENGVCIVVHGEEDGDYWLVEEKYPNGIPEVNSDAGEDVW